MRCRWTSTTGHFLGSIIMSSANRSLGMLLSCSGTRHWALRSPVASLGENARVERRKQDVKISRLFAGKKNLYFIILFATGFLFLVIWLWSASPDTVFRIIRYNTSGIDDYKIFPNRQLQASQTPFHFIESSDKSRVPQIITFGEERDIPLDELLKSNDTVAFLIIKDDTILFERYYDGYTQSSPSLSFSMAKSFLSILIGCAIDDGYI